MANCSTAACSDLASTLNVLDSGKNPVDELVKELESAKLSLQAERLDRENSPLFLNEYSEYLSKNQSELTARRKERVNRMTEGKS